MWKKFHGHCYRYFSRRHTWEDAEKDCREHSGHLASIHSLAEQKFVRGKRPERTSETVDMMTMMIFIYIFIYK